MVAICSRSTIDSDRALRLRKLSTNLPSEALAPASAGGAVESPRVSGFLGESALRIWSALNSSPAKAGPTAIDNAAPIARTALSARRLRLPDMLAPDMLAIALTLRAVRPVSRPL